VQPVFVHLVDAALPEQHSDVVHQRRQRAEELFTEFTRPLAHPDITDPDLLAAAEPWTLHDLRHSALTHAAENGANTGRCWRSPGTPQSPAWPATPASHPKPSPAGKPEETPTAAADPFLTI
jgi:hypothetical protein